MRISVWGARTMLYYSRVSSVIAFSLALGACSIRPLPEDVTGVTTYHIVRQIRCETRAAIISSAIGWLTSENMDPESRGIGLEFAENRRPIETLHPRLFRGRVRAIMTVFYDTGIAYNYNLEMTENNNLDPSINLLKPFTNGKFTLGINGLAHKQRQNIRTFTVTDTFSGLVQNVPENYCTGFIVQENYKYPIVGKIGMEKVIQEFIRLTLFGSLAGPKGQEKGPPTMVDELEFTTTFSLTATPAVVFTPVGNALQVTNASLIANVIRKDVHKVTVGLAIAGPGVSQVGPVRSLLFTPLLTAQPGSRAEQLAAEAVNQALTLRLFKPTIVVGP